MSRRRIIAMGGGAAAIAAITIVGFAAASQAGRAPDAQEPAQPVTHEVQQDPQEVEEYWTEERMRNAKPAPMPEVK
ncbi:MULTISPECIES: hypothetical protein [Thermomonospora]|uniref:Secreted protein n=1 Tax=Thermomonospora curvata (strain ATCC 19995 / DSM 43183 / JCM 3096 / KCTC 9072 / NBRC 15933 / NCIMB 10081 / Henssen B9) TaxID=471852 RepID=D1A8N1_THECD|nr:MULTISPECIES: hypothetical protein [Thermomonospora]ACY96726.1 hypothetical protein Tcur_1141 [Thermomonospora curvata DSM 43183]